MAEWIFFRWAKVPGEDSSQVILLINKLLNKDGEWAKNADVTKIDDSWSITVSDGKKSCSISLNEEKTKAFLKTDDGTTHELSASWVNGRLIIGWKLPSEQKEKTHGEKLGDFAFEGAALLDKVRYILLIVGIVTIFISLSIFLDIYRISMIILLVLIPILIFIGGISWRLNPFEGRWRKVAALFSLIPFVGIIPAAYYFFIKDDRKMDDLFLGVICWILWVLLIIFASIAVGKGWIGYCAGNEICIKWERFT